MELVRDDAVDNQVKAQVSLALRDLRARLANELSTTDMLWRANHQLALDEIDNWLERGAEHSLLTQPLPMPPGAPI